MMSAVTEKSEFRSQNTGEKSGTQMAQMTQICADRKRDTGIGIPLLMPPDGKGRGVRGARMARI